ncbi:MAG: hypothetical protein WBH47_09535 [Streptosporangiaceae bacterium]
MLPVPPPERGSLPQESPTRSDRSTPVEPDARWEQSRPAEQPLSPSGLVPPELPELRSVSRPALGAKLSLADLARVRQALALLSDDPAAADKTAAGHQDGPVPASGAPDQQPRGDAADRDPADDEDTRPLPVILPGATTTLHPETPQAPRGPFEPARPSQDGSLAESQPAADEPDPAEGLPAAAAAKLDQIKDLLLTAEALGEQNLDRHFDQVSQRQRELIREFFEQAAPARDAPG